MNPSLEYINSAREQKNTEQQSGIGISVELKKLQIASKLALSKGKKNKIQGEAEELLSNVDSKIKSLALQKFVVRKTKRVKALGETREKINELIQSLEEANETILDKAKTSVFGFGIDKRFIGLSAEEVLEKINGVPSEDQPSSASDQSVDPSAGTHNQSKSSRNPSKSSRNLSTPEVDKLKDDVNQNNEKIYDYLVKKGELDVADYVLDLMTAPQKDASDPKKLSDTQKNTEEVKKLSVVNSGIREELEKIKEKMVDEQDTSLNLPKKLEKKKGEETKSKEDPKKKDKKEGKSLLDTIMGFLGGSALKWFWKLLKGAKGVDEFAGKIIKSGWKATSGLIGKLFSSKFAVAFAAAFKGAFESAYNTASKAVTDTLEFLKNGFTKLVDLVRKIPGVGKLIPESWGSGGKNTPKPGEPIKTSEKPGALDKTATPEGKPVEKPNKLSASKMGEASDDVAKKVSKEASKEVAKDAAKGAAKAGAKETAKDIAAKKGGKILPKLLKFAKPIPLLGTAITAGTAIYAAYDGYENAAEITGKQNPTTEQKFIAAAANVVDDASFGVLSSKTVASKIMEFVGSEEVKEAREKYERSGIITYHRIGDSVVNNWGELKKLPPEEIQKIINIDDWSKKDLAELQKAKSESEASAKAKSVSSLGVKKLPSGAGQEPTVKSAQNTTSGSSPVLGSAATPEKVPSAAPPTPSPEQKKTSQEPITAKPDKPAKISENAGKTAMVSALDKAKITDPTARAAIMAQVATESGGFKVLSENLNYKPGTLTKLWPKKFADGDAQEVAAGGPVKVAERVYSSRMGNGPEGSGDAWNYRGRGFIQLTGKNNYQRFGYASNPDDLTSPETAAESALKYMGGFRGDWGNVTAVSKYVNGGTIGLEERMKWFEAMKSDPEVTSPGTSASQPTKSASTSDTSIPSGAGTVPSVKPSGSGTGKDSSSKPAPITETSTASSPSSSTGGSSQNSKSSQTASGEGSGKVYKLSAVMKAQPGVDLNVNKGFEERLAAMATSFKEQTGKTLLATSGLRTNEKQKELWDAKLAETGGNVAEARKWVAMPAPPLGQGRPNMHQNGVAIDINSKGAEGINKLAGPASSPTGWLEKFGLTRPIKHEDWHVQPSDAKIATPDNPDNPGKPIDVPDKTGKPFDVATGKSETIGAPKKDAGAAIPTKSIPVDQTASASAKEVDPSDNGPGPIVNAGPMPGTSTPSKSQKDILMMAIDSASIKQAKIETDVRTMQGGMASLAMEFAKASGSGNRAKMENIRQALQSKYYAMQNVQNPVQDVSVADKSIVSKDKTIQATEQTYSSAVNNTQNYDKKTSGGSSGVSQTMTINNKNGGNQQKEEKTNPFEMFDNLQEA